VDPGRALELLNRHAPRLHFDALECLRPTSFDSYLGASAMVDRDGNPAGDAQDVLAGKGNPESWLDPLPADRGDLNSIHRSNLLLATFGPGAARDEAGTCYGRAVPHGKWIYLQYWFFYVDNPYVIPPGRHDGDWEMVQMALRQMEGGEPELRRVTVAQHGHGYTREVDTSTPRPPIYVAAGSHAAYLDPGTHPHFPIPDECAPIPDEPGDFDYRRVPTKPPKVLLLPAEGPEHWDRWPGRWGMDRGAGTWLALHLRMKKVPFFLKPLNHLGAGDSPVSPARQGASWKRPWNFQKGGTGRRWLFGIPGWIFHLIGRASWPRADSDVSVYRISDEVFSITAKPSGHLLRRIERVMVRFHEQETGKPIAIHTVPTGRTTGRLDQSVHGEIVWRAAGYNWLRQRGKLTETKSPTNAIWPLRVGGITRSDQGAREVFETALASYLRRGGSRTTAALVGRFGWFWLKLSKAEVAMVVEAARRDEIIAPLGLERDASGKKVTEDEWVQTARGRGLKRIRGLSLPDLFSFARGVTAPVTEKRDTAETVVKFVATPLVTLLPFLSKPLGVSTVVFVALAGAILALSLATGIRGEVALRRAARRWPRLQTCRPDIYRWQTADWRVWERVPVVISMLGYVVVAGAALRLVGGWHFNVWLALAILAGVLVLVTLFLWRAWKRWLSLAAAYRAERRRLRKLRSEEPQHPCVKGHKCAAAAPRKGRSASCPRFGPKAVAAERER
jgi:uncharacterized protein (DUF983 family)